MLEIPDCLIPAAGRSRRMGTWKPALSWGGDTLLRVVVESSLKAGCRVILVGGYRYRELRNLVEGLEGVEVVRSRFWPLGMGAVLRRGLRELHTERFFVTPADMPLIKSEDYLRLATAGDAVRPVFGGRPGHPVLLRRSILPFAPFPWMPFRKLLKGMAVRGLNWDHGGVVSDIDTAEDYEKALKRLHE